MSDQEDQDETQKNEDENGEPYDPFETDKKGNEDLNRGFEPVNPDDFNEG